MGAFLSKLPIGAWAGLVIIGLGAWARDIYGVVLGGILAVVTLVLTDRDNDRDKEESPGEGPTLDERFKDL